MDVRRILDANANRAREALRTLEEAARLGLDDAALARTLKTLRHELAGAVARLEAAAGEPLVEGRDVAGDVGTGISVPDETVRADVASVVRAASGRLAESLRVLEEYGKTLDAGAPARLEQVRYRAYDCERRLLVALGLGPRPQWRLCVLVTEAACAGRGWEDVAEAAIAGGADCVQLREKGLADRALLERARRLVALAGERAAVVVNDRADVAAAAGATGVHLGQDDLPVETVRRVTRAGRRLHVGVSTSRIEEARAARAAGADLCGVGPMHASDTKAKDRIAGPAYLAEYLAWDGLPHLAIGGIDAARAAVLAAAGARGVAVCAAVCAADDPEAAARAIRAAVDAGVAGVAARAAEAPA